MIINRLSLKKTISKLINYYLNNIYFYQLCTWTIENYSKKIVINYRDSGYFESIKNKYSDLLVKDFELESFLEGIRSDKNDILVLTSFWLAGIKARNLKK